DEASACIQVLGRIRTTAALKKLGGFARDKRKRVTRALNEALGQVVPEDISRSGLADDLMASLDTFVVGDTMHLRGNFVYCLSLEPLDNWTKRIPDNIIHLSLENCYASDLFVLSAFPNLVSLVLSGNTLPKELYVLANLKHLALLDLRNGSETW